MLDRAKQQYLALLLNIASGKLQTFGVISEDDGTASQALQQIAGLIMDGTESNDELAKDIADAINNAEMLPAGVIDHSYETIPYDEDVAVSRVAPTRFAMSQNHPNPANGLTTIELSLPVETEYVLSIYDMSGRLVRELAHTAGPGLITIHWDGMDRTGSPVSSGLFFFRVDAGSFTETRKMLMIR
jgi:hypothetical protein